MWFFFVIGRFGRVIITTKDGDRNLIRPEVFKEIRILDGLIHNATATYDYETFRYEDVCARSLGECYENSILNIDEFMDEVSCTSNTSRQNVNFILSFFI